MDGTRLEFGSSLNCIIGGRGTGKTTVLEALRWGLDQMPPVDRARQRRQAVEQLIRENVGDGTVHIEVETAGGSAYSVSRAQGQAPIVQTAQGETINVDLSRGNIFAADVYSQNEVEEIALDPLLQLALLDRTIDEEIKAAEEQIGAVVKALNANAETIRRLRTEIADQREQIRDLPAIEERIREFTATLDPDEPSGVGAAHEENAAREEENHALGVLRQSASEVEEGLGKLDQLLAQKSEQLTDLRASAGPNTKTIDAASDVVRALLDSVTKHIRDAQRATEEALGRLDALHGELGAAHREQAKAYQTLLDKFRAERSRGRERARLEKQRSEFVAKKQLLDQATKKLEAALEERRKRRAELSEVRDQRFELRRSVVQKLDDALMPMIRVGIEQFGNPEEYQRLLMQAMKGSRIRYAALVDKIVECIPPSALATLVQGEDKASLATQLDVDQDRVMRLIMQLKDRPGAVRDRGGRAARSTQVAPPGWNSVQGVSVALDGTEVHDHSSNSSAGGETSAAGGPAGGQPRQRVRGTMEWCRAS